MKSKLAIIDARVNKTIQKNLAAYAENTVLFSTNKITYPSISCHPDIFIYQNNTKTIIAPNTPLYLKRIFNQHNISYQEGTNAIGNELYNTCYYNCISTENTFLHKKGYTDPSVLEENKTLQYINLPQAYTRCSMLHIGNNKFITSDAGIYKQMTKNHLDTFLFSPFEIQIAQHRYGFLGGTCGLFDGKVFFLGNPHRHKDGKALISFLERNGIEGIALCNTYLYDGGGIFFFQ